MADIELVIKIPEELYKNKKGYLTTMDAHMICDAVGKGTPLPKRHGNLFDENDFEKRVAIMTKSMDLGYGEIIDIIDEIPTIIEADKAE